MRHRISNSSDFTNRLPYLSRIFFIFVFSLAVVSTVFSQSDASKTRLIEYLAQEKIHLMLSINAYNAQPATPKDEAGLKLKQEQDNDLYTVITARIKSFDAMLKSQVQQRQDLKRQLKLLQQSAFGLSNQIGAQERIALMNAEANVYDKVIELLNDNLEQLRRYQADIQQKIEKLAITEAKFEKNNTLAKLDSKIVSLRQETGDLYKTNLELQHARKQQPEFQDKLGFETQLLLNNQRINLLQYQISDFILQKEIAEAHYLYISHTDIRTLQTVIETYKRVVEQLEENDKALRSIVTLLDTKKIHLSDKNLVKKYNDFQEVVQQYAQEVDTQKEVLTATLGQVQANLKKQLSSRQSFSEYHLESWPTIGHQILDIPEKLYQYLKPILLKIIEHYYWQDTLPKLYLWLKLIGVVFFAFILRSFLCKITQDNVRQRFSGHLYDGILTVLYRNIGVIVLTALSYILLNFGRVPQISYQLIFQLIAVWLFFRSMIIIAKLSLFERLTDESGKDVTLYYRLKWLLLIGGWVSAFMVISHQLPLSPLLQDLFSRLFMLFLLIVSFVLWKSKDVVVYLLRPALRLKKNYVKTVIALLVFLIPFTLFTNALVGLAGYINFAWSMSQYQALIVLAIVGFVLIRGLMFDALELISELMISKLHNGWLWIEVFLKPLDKIARICLFIASMILLAYWFGWFANEKFSATLIAVIYYPLVNVSGIHITLYSIISFIILVSIFIWAARWTREFCYRWLYRNTRDPGIRNSLSVFTQYAVILIGTFVTLRALGLDLSGMSMILGGLAVGMGFGLRDFASNIVGGLMLLIERPIREGDLISLGEYEGRVAHIGIRSTRVSSWDNMEVLIPNAEAFNKPFTNWTHQDSIVRTVLPVKVSRGDEPSVVQRLIFEVLAIIPEVLTEPEPQVYLKQIDDALLEFEVRYYINVELHTRFEVRSKVLFAIMAQFKAAGIEAPIPPFSIEIKEKADANKYLPE